MARRHRFHRTDATYHVMLRGNDGQTIFFSDKDRVRMCLLIQEGVERFGHSIEAFCFMSNHIHLAVRVDDINISRVIQHLAFRYARYINRHYNRIGHLFQGRFKSVLVDDENYVKELIRYIHLNPVRANLVGDPQEYPWSSHRTYLEIDKLLWLNIDRILNKFHPEREVAVKIYDNYVFQGIGIRTEFDFQSGFRAGIIGNEEFIEEIVIKKGKSTQPKIELADLVAKVCEMNKISVEQLCMPGKQPRYSESRALIAYFVRKIDHISLQSLAQFLGRDLSTLTKLAGRFEMKVNQDQLASTQVEEIHSWLSDRMPKCQNTKSNAGC